jgi:hypothetical protein
VEQKKKQLTVQDLNKEVLDLFVKSLEKNKMTPE